MYGYTVVSEDKVPLYLSVLNKRDTSALMVLTFIAYTKYEAKR